MRILSRVLSKIVSVLVERKPTWLNSLFTKAVVEYGFVPNVISNRKYTTKWEDLGFHISQNHFYHPIPDMRAISEEYWSKGLSINGLVFDYAVQKNILSEIVEKYAIDYNQFPQAQSDNLKPWEYFVQNGNFTSVDGEVAYSFVRKFKPKRIIEIGSGYSTFVLSRSIEDERKTNPDYFCHFTAIEPFPRDFFRTSIPSLSELIEKPVQSIGVDFFKSLQKDDILFIDSSHVCKYGSDVEFELFDILPNLNVGVIVHFHDIFWPKPYPKEWVVEKGWFWNEQYFLQAFLSFNDSFEILWCGSLMHNNYPTLLQSGFPRYDPEKVNPGSLWIRRIK